jgi:zinc protease
MSLRFLRPDPGAPVAVKFPPIARETLDNGLAVWSLPFDGVPVASIALVIRHGTAADPADRPGLASLTADLLDEGAGQYDAIRMAEAFSRLGTELEVDASPDSTALVVTCLARVVPDALALLSDVVARPHLEVADFNRVRELRTSRLRQLSRSASTAADRAFISTVFGAHPYGHGALGTIASLEGMTVDDARSHWKAAYGPSAATLVVTGALPPDEVHRAVGQAFGSWRDQQPLLAGPNTLENAAPAPKIVLVDRPGSAQSELRIGHLAPSRHTSVYHRLVVLNAVLGGQFTSRINRRLREEKGVTYGARSSFDFRRVAGTFSCDASVQTDATASAVADVLEELRFIGSTPVGDDELSAAQASLTRGYVRHFETAGQLTRAVSQLVTLDLPDDTFDRFVPAIDGVTSEGIQDAAQTSIRPHDASIIVVGDASACATSLEALGREVVGYVPEF